MDRGAWQAPVHMVAKIRTGLKQLNTHTHTHTHTHCILLQETNLEEQGKQSIIYQQRNIIHGSLD